MSEINKLKTPLIVRENSDVQKCRIGYYYKSEIPLTVERSDVFLNVPASTKDFPAFEKRQLGEGFERGWVAIKHTLDRHWFTADAGYVVNHQHRELLVLINTDQACDEMAFGVDPRMTKEDVDGATRIYKNETNDGWLFAHSDVGHHHDHEIQLMAGIDGLIQPMFRQYHVDVISGATIDVKNRAAELYKLLSIFYGEMVGLARKNARAVLLGTRHKEIHPEAGHLHTEIKAAFEDTKTEWETNRASDATKLRTAFTYISNVLTIPDPEPRWVRQARLDAEAKKKAKSETTLSEGS